MADVNLFKNAVRKKYRFDFRGAITVEDLWDLNVRDLDTVYKKLKQIERQKSEESLLTQANAEDTVLSEKIAIVKEIVEDKLAEQQRAKDAVEKRARNQKIMDIIEKKKDNALESMSVEELEKLLKD